MKGKLTGRGGGRRPEPSADSPSPEMTSLIIVFFFLFAVRQRGAGSDLPVAVQPLLHHLRDERVVAPSGAFLEGYQDAALRHAAVQPLPQQFLLLLFVPHL